MRFSRDGARCRYQLCGEVERHYQYAPVRFHRRIIAYQKLLESLHVKLTEEEVQYLEEPYRPRNIIGHA